MSNEEQSVEVSSAVDKEAFEIFNLCLSEYIDSSWFTILNNGIILQNLSSSPRVTKRLSRLLSDYLKIDPISPSELSDPIVSEVYLTQPWRLRQLVWTLGLLVYSDELRLCVDGEKTRNMINKIGKASYCFALSSENSEISKVSMERSPLLIDNSYAPSCDELILRAGLRVLAPFLLKQSAGLNRRISLKLPVLWAHQLAFPFQSVDAVQSLKLIERSLRDPIFQIPPVDQTG